MKLEKHEVERINQQLWYGSGCSAFIRDGMSVQLSAGKLVLMDRSGYRLRDIPCACRADAIKLWQSLVADGVAEGGTHGHQT